MSAKQRSERPIERAVMTVALIASVWACAPRATVDVSEIMNHGRCAHLEPGATWVTLDELAEIRGVQLLGMETPQATPQASQVSSELPSQHLLAVSNGSQPTAGYAFELGRVSASGNAIELYLNWHKPDADAYVAQVLTSPCAVFAVAGYFESLSIYIDNEHFASLAPTEPGNR